MEFSLNFIIVPIFSWCIKYITIIRNPWRRMASLFEQIVLRHKVGEKRKSKNREIRNISIYPKILKEK